jgi:IclR family pca regulon transcriptional regulator
MRTLARGMGVLECFTPAEPTLTFSEIMERLDLPSPTVARFLESLQALGYVAHVPEQGYCLTVKSLGLARACLQWLSVPPWTLSRLESLAEATGHMWSLSVLQGSDLVRISFGGWKQVRRDFPIGERVRATADTPSAVAILANCPPDVRDAFIADALSGRPDFDVQRFREELEDAAKRGYAMADRPDLDPPSSVIAVPVCRGADRVAIASVAIYCRLANQNAALLARRQLSKLQETAAAISSEWGVA